MMVVKSKEAVRKTWLYLLERDSDKKIGLQSKSKSRKNRTSWTDTVMKKDENDENDNKKSNMKGGKKK